MNKEGSMDKLFVIVFFCAQVLCLKNGWSDSLIKSSDCIIGQASGPSPIVKVSTIGSGCYDTCQTYCAQQFKVDSLSSTQAQGSQANAASTPSSSTLFVLRANVIEFNRDRIEACLQACFQSQPTTPNIRIPMRVDTSTGSVIEDDGTKPYPWLCDIQSSATDISDLSCGKSGVAAPPSASLCSSGDMMASYFDGNISVTDGSSVLLTISHSPGNASNNIDDLTKIDGNNIYLCGFSSVIFSPLYWNSQGWPIAGNESTQQTFNPRSHTASQPLLTGISIMNDDYVSMKYMGQYYSTFQQQEFGIGMGTLENKPEWFWGWGWAFEINVSEDDNWTVNVPGAMINDTTDANQRLIAQQCSVCMQDPSNAVCMSPTCSGSDTSFQLKGLQGNVGWASTPSLFASTTPGTSKFRVTSLAGNISNVSGKPLPFYIYYPNSNYNAYGGYLFAMSWRGCHFTNGERLQYTVVNDAILHSPNFVFFMNQYAEWRDAEMQLDNGAYSQIVNVGYNDLAIPAFMSNDINVTANNRNTGKIYLRIKTLSQDEASQMGVKTFDRSNTLGQYYVKVLNSPGAMTFNGLVDRFGALLDGVAQSIFQAFKNNTTYLTIIRLVLILYIAFVGLTFMTGMAQITQAEAVARIFKISVVVMLLSPSSIVFFNENLFALFSLDTMNAFANLFTPDIEINLSSDLQSQTTSCFHNPQVKVALLCVLEKDLQLFFSWAFWNRIMGMIISGLLVAAIAIIAGIILYAIVVLKVLLLFCIAMLALTVTLALAPIFIPLILFKYTKSFFDSWIKQLVSITLQPVFIFTAISLFRVMFAAIVQAALGMAACKICWLEFTLPFGNYCLFNLYFYVPLSLGSSPDAFSSPISDMGILISLFIVGHGMYSFCTFAAEMSSKLINYTSFNVAQTGIGPGKLYGDVKKFGSVVYNAATSPLDVLAIDDKSRQIRKSARKARRDEQERNKEKRDE